MKKFKIRVEGGLLVPREALSVLSLEPYIYNKKGVGDIASTKFIQVDGERFVSFPRNMPKFDSFFKEVVDYEYVDNRVAGDDIKYNLNGSFALRVYQEQPVRDLVNSLKTGAGNSVILQAEPSFGKTFILPKIILNIGKRALILVDRDLLRDQMFDEFSTNSTAKVMKLGKHTAVVDDLGDVNIATFQLLLKNESLVKLLANHVGIVVVDECHVAPAEKFSAILSQIPAKFRLGLSATPTRSDGLTSIITDTFGSAKVIGTNPNNLKVTSVVVDTHIPVNFSTKAQYAKQFIKSMTSPLPKSKRTPINLAITMAVELHKRNRRVLLYVTYVDLQSLLQRGLTSLGLTVGVIQGKTPKLVRKTMIDDFQSGKLDFLVSGVILQKGVSIHRLDTIINLVPQNKENLEQVVGRLRREYEGKPTPLFVYFTFVGKLEYGTALVIEALKRATKKGDKFHRISVDGFMKQVKENTK